MASYVVMMPPESQPDGLPEFVRDHFAIWGFLAPPLWLAWHRLWLEAAVALILMLAIPAVAAKAGIGPVASWLCLLVSLFVGLEGSALRLTALRWRGWADEGVYEGDDLQDAETRFAAEAATGPWSI